MTLLDQLCAIEARARRDGRLRFIAGHAYPVPENEMTTWLKTQGPVKRTPRARQRFGIVFREGALV